MKKNYSIIEFDKFRVNFSCHPTLGCHFPEGNSNVIHMMSRIKMLKMICLSGITWFSDCESCHHTLELPRVWDLGYERKFVLKLRKMAFLSERERTHLVILLAILLLLSRFSHVRLCATPETTAHQAPPSMGFAKQEYWIGLPLPSP